MSLLQVRGRNNYCWTKSWWKRDLLHRCSSSPMALAAGGMCIAMAVTAGPWSIPVPSPVSSIRFSSFLMPPLRWGSPTQRAREKAQPLPLFSWVRWPYDGVILGCFSLNNPTVLQEECWWPVSVHGGTSTGFWPSLTLQILQNKQCTWVPLWFCFCSCLCYGLKHPSDRPTRCLYDAHVESMKGTTYWCTPSVGI